MRGPSGKGYRLDEHLKVQAHAITRFGPELETADTPQGKRLGREGDSSDAPLVSSSLKWSLPESPSVPPPASSQLTPQSVGRLSKRSVRSGT